MNEFPGPLDPESEVAYTYENPEWDEGEEMTDDEIEGFIEDLHPEWSGRMTTHIHERSE